MVGFWHCSLAHVSTIRCFSGLFFPTFLVARGFQDHFQKTEGFCQQQSHHTMDMPWISILGAMRCDSDFLRAPCLNRAEQAWQIPFGNRHGTPPICEWIKAIPLTAFQSDYSMGLPCLRKIVLSPLFENLSKNVGGFTRRHCYPLVN